MPSTSRVQAKRSTSVNSRSTASGSVSRSRARVSEACRSLRTRVSWGRIELLLRREDGLRTLDNASILEPLRVYGDRSKTPFDSVGELAHRFDVRFRPARQIVPGHRLSHQGGALRSESLLLPGHDSDGHDREVDALPVGGAERDPRGAGAQPGQRRLGVTEAFWKDPDGISGGQCLLHRFEDAGIAVGERRIVLAAIHRMAPPALISAPSPGSSNSVALARKRMGRPTEAATTIASTIEFGWLATNRTDPSRGGAP